MRVCPRQIRLSGETVSLPFYFSSGGRSTVGGWVFLL